MESFGTKLRREREQRKVTLEDVSLSTKIATRHLQALEADKFDQLPGGIEAYGETVNRPLQLAGLWHRFPDVEEGSS